MPRAPRSRLGRARARSLQRRATSWLADVRCRLSSPAYRDWADYILLEDGRAVGRIYEDRHTLPGLRWFWSITMYVNPKRGITTSGRGRAWMRPNSIPIELAEVPRRLDSRGQAPYLNPPCPCVRVPCRRASLRRVSLHPLPSRLPVTAGCTKSSTTASG
jgi:hypothetical protein